VSESAEELYREGVEAFRRGEKERSRELNEQSLALARQDGDAAATVNALIGLARVALREGDLERVHALAAEARDAAEEEASLALPLHLDAEATRMSGDFARARRLYEQSIELNRRLGDEYMVAAEESNLAWVEINEGRLDEAEELVTRSLSTPFGEHPYGGPFCTIALARCAAERGDPAQARKLLTEADERLAAAGLVLDPADRPEYDKTVELARER
jgi:ATP/maltotriose-dependent transcriptional regulator MalT